MSRDAAEHFKRLRGVYRAAFCQPNSDKLSPAGKEVIANLKALCSFGTSPFRPDPVTMAYTVGQQDVVRHILMTLNMPDEEIYRLTASTPNNEDPFFNA